MLAVAVFGGDDAGEDDQASGLKDVVVISTAEASAAQLADLEAASDPAVERENCSKHQDAVRQRLHRQLAHVAS